MNPQNKETLTEALNLFDHTIEQPGALTQESLYRHLKKLVQDLIDHHIEKLILLLYRIDVDEEKVKQVLAASEPSEISENLTNLIIERQYQKIISRKKYKQ